MENDVQLLQKLLALGHTIQEIRTKQEPAQRCSSETSLSSAFEEEEADEWRPMEDQFSSSMSAITRLYVADENDVDEHRPNVQYFSRKNSVLRIPIPPRASNRAFTRRNATRPADISRFAAKADANGVLRLHLQTHEDSGQSSSSSASLSPTSPPATGSNTFNMPPSYRRGPLSTAAAASSAKSRFSKANGYEPFSLCSGSMQDINVLTSKSRQERWATRFAN
ncbi:Protein T25D10.4 [Aphelenchoides avenae]|nr:Protein T25D10.4 [Aphelenchus avenae]